MRWVVVIMVIMMERQSGAASSVLCHLTLGVIEHRQPLHRDTGQ